MKRPIPPSHFKTQDGDVREDLRRIRLYLEQLNDWVAANSGSGGSGDLTQAAADLLYLKRAANDFTTFTAKAVPTAADVLLIEDAANAFAKKKVSLGSVGQIGVWQGSVGRVPLWVPPVLRGLSANANDKEFDVDADVTGAIQVWDQTNSVVRTPTYGAIDRSAPSVGPGPPRIQLPSSGRPSFVKIQTSGDVNMITWPVTVPTNVFIWCCAGALMAVGGIADTCEFGFGGTTSGHADRTKSFLAGKTASNLFRNESNGVGGGGIGPATAYPYVGVWKLGTTYRGYAFNDDGEYITDFAPVINAATMDRWGFLMAMTTGGGGANGHLNMLDFMRMAPSPLGILDGV